MLTLPAFGEVGYFDHIANQKNRVITIPNADVEAFDAYCSLFEKNGCEKREAYQRAEHFFAAYSDGETGYFINYFGSVRELTLVAEESCRYFSYEDMSASACVDPQITQVKLKDYGMSYVIRLSDGRLVVIDGGRDLPPDVDQLFETLKESAQGERPVIAAWIFSHPHVDHFCAFIGFMERYAEQIDIEKFLFYFPEADDFVHYPSLAPKDPAQFEQSESHHIEQVLAIVERLGVPVYTPHTGQTYRIGDAVCEILACIDDTIHRSRNVNMTSLVIRMELGGQVIIWGGDASFGEAQLPEKYGDALKADILQVPHHGFQCGDAEGELAGYRLIAPKVCLLPASDYTAYTFFCLHRAGTRYLMREDSVDEIITGEEQRTLTLPYTAPASAKTEHIEKYNAGVPRAGATTWIFSELSTACPDDFVFTILNTTVVETRVRIELYFEDGKKRISFIETSAPKYSLKKLCIIGDEGNPDYDPSYLTKRGISENVLFAVRFLSEVPVVISNSKHKATYFS